MDRSDAVDRMEREAFHAFFPRFVRVRLLVGGALLATVALSLVGDDAWWRPWAAGVVGLFAVAGGGWQWWTRREPNEPIEAPLAQVIAVLGTFVFSLLLVSGGLESPLLPIALAISVFSSFLIRLRWILVLPLSLGLVVWAFFALAITGAVPDLIPAIFGGGRGAGHAPSLLLATAVTTTFFLLAVALLAGILRGVYRRLALQALEARDETLEAHQENLRALTTLTGELAHELKNPLASVKGLAALLARDLDGRAGERLSVLRREVERMHGVLESFLNFSRPMAPLDTRTTELGALCRQVATLHEGLAAETGVGLRVEAPQEVQVACDPRKVRQVLINLVQNALEASGQGEVVELAVSSAADGARLVVRDRGTGLAAPVRERLFEAGVTTKETGSGLGLAIARALALQHGGALELRAREGGGCVAELALPSRPPVISTVEQEVEA